MTWAILLGSTIGSVPTADLIARARGHDLRSEGSGNPGTANALRVAGRAAAIAILALDVGKGAAAALLGERLAGTAGAVAGGVAAIAGQVLNPWFGFKGGKGLGVTAGVTLALWPPGALVSVGVVAAGAAMWRAAVGALLGLAAYFGGTVLWADRGWDTWWGIPPDDRLVWLGIGVLALTVPKFIGDLGR